MARTVLAGLLLCMLTASGSAAASQGPAPVKVFVFGSPVRPEAAEGVGDSVADFDKAVREKFGRTLQLVGTRQEADVAVEILERDRELFSRSIRLRVHHRGGQPNPLYRWSGQGGFAVVAFETMNLIDKWAQRVHSAVTGLEGPEALRKLPVDVFEDIQELKGPDGVLRANAAERLGARGHRAAIAIPDLLEWLGDKSVVATRKRGGSGFSLSGPERVRVGSVIARALLNVGAADELFSALESDPRELARQHVAGVLGATIPQPRTIAALETAVQKDPSPRVREIAAASLQALKK